MAPFAPLPTFSRNGTIVLKLQGGKAAGLTKAQESRIVASIEGDLELLRAFCRRVDHLERSGFSKRFEVEIPRVIAKMEDVSFEQGKGASFSFVARIHSWIEDFSQDEIDAFVLSYRVFTQRNDRLSIPSLAKIYSKEWIPPRARECFEDARLKLNEMLDNAATVEFPNGQISVRFVVDTIIYGGLAHSNEKKAKIFDSWQQSGFMGFMWADFMAYAREAVDTLKYIRGLSQDVLDGIEKHGLLIEAVPADPSNQ
jgi:hypothetical protein